MLAFRLCTSFISSISSLSSQLNTSWNDSMNGWITLSTLTSFHVSTESDVTLFPFNPHGTMCSNQFKSTLQFKAKPWDVIQRLTWNPEKKRSTCNWRTLLQKQCVAECFFFNVVLLCSSLNKGYIPWQRCISAIVDISLKHRGLRYI